MYSTGRNLRIKTSARIKKSNGYMECTFIYARKLRRAKVKNITEHGDVMERQQTKKKATDDKKKH